MRSLIPMALVLAGFAVPQEDDGRLVCEELISAPAAEVWAAFTTKAGLESWMVPHAEIDLRVGGLMKTNYDSKGRIGDPKTIENTILSLDPERMISIKATKPPEGFPYPEAIKGMWTVVYFDEVDSKKTRVRVVSLGFGSDEESKKMRAHFKAGNAWTLKCLKKKFAGKD